MDYELPTEFDIIIVGTGIVESILSAAASRIGKTVLHIDSQDYYGGFWASFNLEQIDKLCERNRNANIDLASDVQLNEGERLIKIGNNNFDLKNASQKWNIPEKLESKNIENVDGDKCDSTENEADNGVGVEEVWTQEKLLQDSRKFNIDIAPKLQFARGDFVELLISSNIARYSEYRSVSRVLTWLNGELEVVPCSRSDVFSNPKVSVIEKRMLMKLLSACMDSEENEFKASRSGTDFVVYKMFASLCYCNGFNVDEVVPWGQNWKNYSNIKTQNYENKTFHAYLKDKKLTDNVIHYVLYAIAMSTIDTPCSEGVENIKRFLNSLGRFGKTPFLYSMYGSGELSQAFCRLSAVFGGVYALNQNLGGFIFDAENKFKGLVCGKQVIRASNLVMGIEKSPEDFVKSVEVSYISRGIFITNGSVRDSEKEHLTLLFYPLKGGKQLCNVIELGTLTGTCPKGIYIVHMFTKQINTPKEDLEECVSKLFQSEKEDSDVKDARPQVLWSFYYSAPDTNTANLRKDAPENAFLCPGPDCDLDIDFSIKKAKEIFNSMYPDVEFLPRAPDPEEIIIGDDSDEQDREKDVEGKAEELKQEQVEETEIDKNAQGDVK
ncbi:rab gdp-dissociation inhibitor [Holotrichia oblita]|uniref:Rab gdp-dissociation inhibitor n=1 Tax=Holotrichia oblita TaxID=644536 RepID=A0ACB9T6S1_HOLOL|nr:rab gdp-dissociation inhibitor [Holotrichia oblita]